MKFWVGVTDKNWFDYLASISPDEVNLKMRWARFWCT